MACTCLISLIWTLLGPALALNNEGYKIIPMEADWEMARRTCRINRRFLMPDLGLDVFQSKISHMVKTNETFWINAKSVEITYPDQPAYLKFAYQLADSKLTAYLCHNANSRETRKYIGSELLSWEAAKDKCGRLRGNGLYNDWSPELVKKRVSLLTRDVTFWVDKMSKDKLPSMDAVNMTEDCIAVKKLKDGSLHYRRDKCSNEHKYICVSSAELFAPTITKLSKPFPFLQEEKEKAYDNITLPSYEKPPSQEPVISRPVLGGIIGSVVGAVFILLVAGLVYYLYRRWQSNKDYRSSLHRYTQRHVSSRKLLGNTMTGSLPMGSCNSCNTGSLNMAEPEGNEDSEKRSYVQCQKEVVQDLKFRYAKYPAHNSSSGQDKHPSHDVASAELEKLPTYHVMDGKKALQVLPAYESYDPDPGQLQKARGYVNKDYQPTLSDLQQYDNIPRLPQKAGKLTALDEREQYENHHVGAQKMQEGNVVSKPLGDTDRTTVTSLEDLEQYENYRVPKRQRGLFQLFRANKAREAAQTAHSKANTRPDSLNDLEDYEKFEPKNVSKKVIDKLDDLDAYENYTLRK